MRRRFGIVKVVRCDGSMKYGVGLVSYEKDPNVPHSVVNDPDIFSVEGDELHTDEDAIIMRLKLMIRDCQEYPICVVNEP